MDGSAGDRRRTSQAQSGRHIEKYKGTVTHTQLIFSKNDSMPLPPALQARLAKRGIIEKGNILYRVHSSLSR